jgi:ABC-type amino acid transport substrate-binding protein
LGQLVKLAVLGIIVGELTAFITTRKIRLNIEGPKDLSGRTVATVQGTTSEPVLKTLALLLYPWLK